MMFPPPHVFEHDVDLNVLLTQYSYHCAVSVTSSVITVSAL